MTPTPWALNITYPRSLGSLGPAFVTKVLPVYFHALGHPPPCLSIARLAFAWWTIDLCLAGATHSAPVHIAASVLPSRPALGPAVHPYSPPTPASFLRAALVPSEDLEVLCAVRLFISRLLQRQREVSTTAPAMTADDGHALPRQYFARGSSLATHLHLSVLQSNCLPVLHHRILRAAPLASATPDLKVPCTTRPFLSLPTGGNARRRPSSSSQSTSSRWSSFVVHPRPDRSPARGACADYVQFVPLSRTKCICYSAAQQMPPEPSATALPPTFRSPILPSIACWVGYPRRPRPMSSSHLRPLDLSQSSPTMWPTSSCFAPPHPSSL
ncbi:hypothetical protein FKP32DRAFT_1761940 [Trametes sanguinea]|nr:hypothetical protein FKP32DRAFT_1761940 [Trametes sanguinea]